MTKPVTLEKAKARLGIRSDHRDAEIRGLIDAAIEHVEKAAHYYLEQRDQVEALDCLVGAVDLKAWPVSAVGDITYLDEDDQDATIANARLIATRKPAYLLPAADESWPGDVAHKLAVTLTVGHTGAEDDPFPAPLVQAILLLVSHWFENQEAVVVGTSAVELPLGVESLVHQFRTVI